MTAFTSSTSFGVERRSCLVKQHHFRLHGERTRDCHTLLLPARQARGIDVDLVGKPDLGQKLQRQRARRVLAHALELDRAERDVFQHGQVREQVEVLEHHAHLLAHRIDVLFERLPCQRLVDLHAVQPDLAAIQRFQMVDRPQERALAGAAGADDGNDLAPRH